MKHIRMAVAVIGVLTLLATVSPANAQEAECPKFEPPNIEYTMSDGRLLQSQSKTAFQLAREKAVKYGVKMPLKQGSSGKGVITAETKVEIQPFQREGCIVVTGITFDVKMDHTIELAKEFTPGSCMQGEFYNLEMELRQQDYAILQEAIKTIRQDIRDDLGDRYVYGPIRALNIPEAMEKKKKEVIDVVNGQMERLNKEIAKARQESDLPEFYDDIERDCNGG